jgi:hypothetical protein
LRKSREAVAAGEERKETLITGCKRHFGYYAE